MEFLLAAVPGALVAATLFIIWAKLWKSHDRQVAARRQSAPPLNPHWDTSVCKHPDVVGVFAWTETEPIAYLCTNPECYAKLELGEDRAQRAQADTAWVEMHVQMADFARKVRSDIEKQQKALQVKRTPKVDTNPWKWI